MRVHPGSKAFITEWGGDRDLPATVRRIDPAGFTKVSALGIEEQRVNVILDLDRPEPRLGDAFRVFARIVSWRGENVLQVPLGALFRTGDDWTVFRVENGHARLVRIRVGHMNGETAEVSDGLRTGDELVLYPGDTVSDGVPVKARGVPRISGPAAAAAPSAAPGGQPDRAADAAPGHAAIPAHR